MFRIRRIHDAILPQNRSAIREVERILAARFPGVPRLEIARLPERLRNPFRERFRPILYVAEDERGDVLGFALVLLEPTIRFTWLDYIANAPGVEGRGIGAALFERVRDESVSHGARGLFFECQPDDPAVVDDPNLLRVNTARLRLYEQYGARPVVGTEW